MTTFKFNYLNNYHNHGQNAEQSVRFTLTGEAKADNVRYDLGADCLNYQIKSARATICKGDNLSMLIWHSMPQPLISTLIMTERLG